MIVEDKHDDGNIGTDSRCHLIHIHMEASIPRNQNNRTVRIGNLGTDRRSHTIAHRPQTAGTDPAARTGKLIILCHDHLMLSDIGNDNRILSDDFMQGQGKISGIDIFSRLRLWQP